MTALMRIGSCIEGPSVTRHPHQSRDTRISHATHNNNHIPGSSDVKCFLHTISEKLNSISFGIFSR